MYLKKKKEEEIFRNKRREKKLFFFFELIFFGGKKLPFFNQKWKEKGGNFVGVECLLGFFGRGHLLAPLSAVYTQNDACA